MAHLVNLVLAHLSLVLWFVPEGLPSTLSWVRFVIDLTIWLSFESTVLWTSLERVERVARDQFARLALVNKIAFAEPALFGNLLVDLLVSFILDSCHELLDLIDRLKYN